MNLNAKFKSFLLYIVSMEGILVVFCFLTCELDHRLLDHLEVSKDLTRSG